MMWVVIMLLPSLAFTTVKAQDTLVLDIKKALEIALSENPTVKVQSAKPPVHLFKTKRFYFEVLFQNEASLLEQNQTAFKWTSNPI